MNAGEDRTAPKIRAKRGQAFRPGNLVDDSWCADVRGEWATFRLHPPVLFDLALGEPRYLALIPFASVMFNVSVGDAPLARRRLRSGSVTFAGPEEPLRARCLEPVEALLLSIAPERVTALAGAMTNPAAAIGLYDAGIAELAREVRRSILGDYPVQPTYLQSLAEAILHRLLAIDAASAVTADGNQAMTPANLTRVVLHIDENIGEPLNVTELAAIAGLTRSHFSRAFQKSTGVPPRRFVTTRRVCRARDLLAATDHPLAEIATASGFASQAHMSTCLRREVGTTPARYRAAFRAGDGSGSEQEPHLDRRNGA